MKKNNNTKYAILGLLTTECRSGYAIKQMIDRSLNHFWKISYGQIYPTLKQLIEEGFVTVQDTLQEGKPDKKEYYLTSDGKVELQNWLQSPIEEIPAHKNEMLLKLFFSRHQSNDKTIGHLESYRQKLQERYAAYKSIEHLITSNSNNEPDAQYWLFTLDHGKRITQSTIEWCDVTIQKLN